MKKQDFINSLNESYIRVLLPNSIKDVPFEIYNMQKWDNKGDFIQGDFNSFLDISNISESTFRLIDFKNSHFHTRLPIYINTQDIQEIQAFMTKKGFNYALGNSKSMKNIDPNKLKANEYLIGTTDEFKEYLSRAEEKDLTL